jgi:hypothetical protein
VTKDILAGTQIDLASKKVIADVVEGNKIVVAGYTAADTVQAGKEFLAKLSRKSA